MVISVELYYDIVGEEDVYLKAVDEDVGLDVVVIAFEDVGYLLLYFVLFLNLLLLYCGWMICVLKDKGCYLLLQVVALTVVDHFLLELLSPEIGNSTFHQ